MIVFRCMVMCRCNHLYMCSGNHLCMVGRVQVTTCIRLRSGVTETCLCLCLGVITCICVQVSTCVWLCSGNHLNVIAFRCIGQCSGVTTCIRLFSGVTTCV